MLVKRITVAVFVVACVADELHARTWTDGNGKQIEAVFVRASGDTVILQHKGHQAAFPISGFSAEDQEYLRGKIKTPIRTSPRQAVQPPAARQLPPPAQVGPNPVPPPTTVKPSLAQNPSDISKPRTWTDSEGRQIKAKFVEMKGQDVVLARGRKNITVPFAKFCQADRELMRTSLAANGKGHLVPDEPQPVIVAQAPSSPPVASHSPGPQIPTFPEHANVRPQHHFPAPQAQSFSQPAGESLFDRSMRHAREEQERMRQRVGEISARHSRDNYYYCDSCKAQVSQSAKSCPKCGVYFSRSQQPDGTWRDNPDPPDDGYRIRFRGKWIGGVVVAIIASIVGWFKAMGRKINDSASYRES